MISKTNNHVTFKQVILKFTSSVLKIECLSKYRIIGIFEKKKCKKKKKKNVSKLKRVKNINI